MLFNLIAFEGYTFFSQKRNQFKGVNNNVSVTSTLVYAKLLCS